MADDLTRARAAADQQLAGMDRVVRMIAERYVELRDSGLSQTDAVCKLGVEVHDNMPHVNAAMAVAVFAGRVAGYRGDVRG